MSAIAARRLALTMMMTLVGCSSSGSDAPVEQPPAPTPGATLASSPSTLAFSDTQSVRTLFLTTTPSGGRLTWQVTAKPDWLVLEPASGTVSGVSEVTVRAIGLATLEPGTLSGRIELVSSGGAAAVTVSAVVSPNPIATVTPAVIALGGTTDTTSFVITNTGRGQLTWSLTSANSWLTASPASGFLATGQRAVVRATVDRSTLAVGTLASALTLRSNARAGDQTIPVSVVVPPTPRIVVSTGRLAFPSGVTSRAFVIRNTGRGALNWSVPATDPWLALSSRSGSVAAGDSALVTATVTRASVPNGATGSFTITSDAVNGAAEVAVEVTTGAPLATGVRVLDHRVVDAEFAASAGLLVTVSANPNRLHVLDTETGASWFVPLSLPPNAVAVRADGAFAAVGHDALVTYVNLVTRAVVRTYPITTNVIDIVLPANGWVYPFPRTDQWVSLRGVDLATGVETVAGGTIRAGTQVRLHPSGDYIYGANNGLSPSDFEKYDIRKGAPVMLYDSPYHGDYAFSGDLWISEDGSRLFARSGNVFRSSPVRAEDMLYAGRLAGVNAVRWAADSRARQRIYVLGSSANPFDLYRTAEVRVYESAFTALVGTVPLPRLSGADVDGYYLFPSADGRRLFVLVKAVASAGLAQDWGLAVLDTGVMP